MFDDYLARWALTPDGPPLHTHSSDLLPVRYHDRPAMLKIAREAEEKLGGLLMRWWDGDGAAPVLAYEGDALLLERATGTRSLAWMAAHDRDDEAARILCAAAARLHAPRAKPLPELLGLEPWFEQLWPAPSKYGGVFAESARTARALLDDPRDVVPLHGDLHHDNVLDFGERGWLAIDPKRLLGERGFDYANIFCNPEDRTDLAQERFRQRVEIVVAASGIERRRLLQWILAWCGLSAAWWLDDGKEAEIDLPIAELALAELRLS
ncbi:MAG TPA: aminoglycoside phosphotransferase family protein [Luteimonas sp.]|nr:aminoglycoside phosphotransferase family protein [Luteimonas sp.]